MDLNRLTEKAQEALLQAQSLAGEYSHSQIEGEHLLLALLRQSDGVVPAIVQGLGLQVGMLTQQVEGELARKPRLSGATAQVGLSRELQETLDRADKIAREMRDDFVSTEHLLLALTDDHARNTARLLGSHGLTRDAILRALSSIRGSQRVTSQAPEGTYQALDKYGRDLTRSSAAMRKSAA
jgi:ATP-dependent Clp protease ATP-binding subunit ClpB